MSPAIGVPAERPVPIDTALYQRAGAFVDWKAEPGSRVGWTWWPIHGLGEPT